MNRRLRGLVAMVTGGALAGAISGALLGLILLLAPGPKEIIVHPEFPGAIVLLPTLLLGTAGALAGGAFGMMLMLTERGRSLDALRVHRAALWAGIAAAPAIRLVGWSWTTVALGSVVSAAIGAAATWVAKRGASRAMPEQVHTPSA